MATTKKTIHDIKLPERKQPKTGSATKTAKKTTRSTSRTSTEKIPTRVTADQARLRVVPKKVTTDDFEINQPKRKGNWKWIIIFLAIILGGGFLYGMMFHSATLSVSPVHQSVPAATSLVFANEPTPTEVPLVVMSLSDTVTRTVRATGSTEVSQRASGKIMIYNNFSTAPQKLLEETRFEAPDGKIYKTAKGNPVTVPGITNGKPGQLEVTVYAAEPGQEYNKDLTDFTVPGFKGSPKYDKLYARSTGSIQGGFVGVRSSLPDDEQARLTAEIGEELGDRLKAEALLQKTDEFIILDQTSKVAISEPSIIPAENNPLQAMLSLTGTYSTILVNKDELAGRLAARLIPTYNGEPISIKNINELQFAVELAAGQDLQSLEKVTVGITGTPVFVFKVPEAELKQELLGITRKGAQNVLARYPSIDSARLIIKPFWRMKAPQDLKSIKIRYNLD